MRNHFLRASGAERITFIASSFAQRATTGTNLVINKPAGTQTGDIMLFIGIVAGSLLWSETSGWTEKLDSSGRNVQVKTATGSEPDTYTFVVSTSAEIPSGYILTYRNAIYDNVGAVSALAQNPVAPSLEVGEDNALVLLVASAAGVTSLYTTPSGWTLVADDTSTAPTSAIFSRPFNSGNSGTVTVNGSAGGTTSRAFLVSIE